MTTENLSPAGTDAQATAAQPDRFRYAIPVVLSTFLTLLTLAPVAYVMWRNMPARVATVDLQKLVEENEKRVLAVLGKGENITLEQRAAVEALAVDFAKKISLAVDAIGADCHCVIVNKAALLGGLTVDYTDQVRARLQ